jgi:hypothetical protein
MDRSDRHTVVFDHLSISAVRLRLRHKSFCGFIDERVVNFLTDDATVFLLSFLPEDFAFAGIDGDMHDAVQLVKTLERSRSADNE